MELQKASIVQAIAGREQGQYFLVLKQEGDFLLLVDGKHRTLDKPKKKRQKHVRFVGMSQSAVQEKIQNDNPITNSELRKAIAEMANKVIQEG